MVTKRANAVWLRAAGYVAAAAMLLAVACEAPAPEQPAGPVASGAVRSVGTVAISDPERSTGLDSPKRLSCPPPSYPQMLLEAGVRGDPVLHQPGLRGAGAIHDPELHLRCGEDEQRSSGDGGPVRGTGGGALEHTLEHTAVDEPRSVSQRLAPRARGIDASPVPAYV